MPATPAAAVAVAVMLCADADQRAAIIARLEPLARHAARTLGVTAADAAADPLDQGRHPLVVAIGDLRILEIQAGAVAGDLRAALDGSPHRLAPEAALAAMGKLADRRADRIDELGRRLPLLAAYLETATGSRTAGRRLRDTVAELRRQEAHAAQVRSDLAALLDERPLAAAG